MAARIRAREDLRTIPRTFVLYAPTLPIVGARSQASAERKAARVTFELDPGAENACEMRLQLQAGSKPLSETWLYRWTP